MPIQVDKKTPPPALHCPALNSDKTPPAEADTFHADSRQQTDSSYADSRQQTDGSFHASLEHHFPVLLERSLVSDGSVGTLDISYVAQDYAKQILAILSDLRKVKRFCDVELIVNEAEILAHRTVLAASSSFFRSMFENKKAESPFATVTITGISEKIMNILINFAYSGNITVGKNNVKDLLTAASSLKFLPVRDACCDFLQRHFTPANSVGIRYFALLEDCTELAAKAEDYIARNFTDVAKCEEFFMLSFNQISEIIALQRYPFRNEQVIAIAIFCWIHHDLPARRQYFKQLFLLIKLELLSAPFILSSLLHNELVKSCPEASQAVLLTVAKLKLLSEDVSKVTLELDSVLCKTPRDVTMTTGDVIMATRDVIKTTPPVVPISPQLVTSPTRPPKKRAKTDEKSPDVTMTTRDVTMTTRDVAMTTNSTGDDQDIGSAFKRTAVFPPSPRDITMTTRDTSRDITMTTRDTSRDMAAKPTATPASKGEVTSAYSTHLRAERGDVTRCHGDVTRCQGDVTRCVAETRKRSTIEKRPPRHGSTALFVVGGACNVNMTDAIKKVEYYEAGLDKWFEAAPLRKSRSLVGVTVLQGTLYAVGGFDGISPIDSVESYNPAQDVWQCMGRMISARRGAGVTTLNSKIYAVGGFDGKKLLSLSECYHVDTNSWEPVATLRTPRFALGAAALNSKIYAVGGYDGCNHLASVEVYDPYTNTWSTVAAMSTRRYAVGATSLNNCIYAVGGLDGTRPLCTVEQYDPRTDKWCSMADMQTQRAGVDVAVLKDELYSVGGILGSSPLQTVEKLECRMNKWRYIAEMSLPRVDAGAGTVSISPR